jgi:hypothetical protein
MILGSAPVPYISVWVLIPSILEGGEVIADALVGGTPWTDVVLIGSGNFDEALSCEPLLPPQPTNSINAVARRSSGMSLSFMPPYYTKRLLNGSAESTAYWQYESGG